jgi:hypothetical protein
MAERCSCRTMAGEPASLGDHQGERTCGHLRFPTRKLVR